MTGPAREGPPEEEASVSSVTRAALVTGSTSGIGLAIARRLAVAGFDVAVNSFEPEAEASPALAQVGDGVAGRVRYFEADLADPAAAFALVGRVAEAFGRLDVLVNNAGTQKVSPI